MTLRQTLSRTLPGISTAIETLEREFVWGTWDVNRTFIMGTEIAAATVDAGNTPTTVLRPGLAMTYNKTAKQATQWTYSATGDNLYGFLLYSENMIGPGGSAVDKWFGYVLVAGQVRTKDLIFDTAGTDYAYGNLVGDPNEAAIRAAVAGRFLFDDFRDQMGT